MNMTFKEEFGEVYGGIIAHKYALKNKRDYVEKGYGDMIERMKQKAVDYPNIMSKDEVDALFEGVAAKRIVFGGRINASFGTSKLTTLSNCYVVDAPKDNYDGIILTDGEIVNIEKRGGGVGTDLTGLRGKGVPVNNSALTSTGAASFANRYSNSTLEVAQEGRRGALMLTMHYKHPDIVDFINLKNDEYSVTGANLSVKIDKDIFLKENEELLDLIALKAWKHAEPGVLFWDNILDNPIDRMKEVGFQTLTTNPCGEIPLNPYASCLLAHQNWYAYVISPFTANARVDIDLIKRDARLLTKFMNIVVEEELKKVDKIISVSEELIEKNLWMKVRKVLFLGRRLGIGKTGIGDFLAAMGLDYGARRLVPIIASAIKNEVIRTSFELPIEAPILKKAKNRERFFKHPFMKDFFDTNDSKYKKMIPANISFITIAPVGTGSMITGTTSGIEPLFDYKYKRKRRATETDTEFTTDDRGDKWVHFDVYHEPYLKYVEINNLKGDPSIHFKESPYFNNLSEDIDVFDKIDLQAILQKYTDQSISVTHNVKKDYPLEKIKPLIKYAHSKQLKGFTLYRDGSRKGILTKSSGADNHSSPYKRPKKLTCAVHSVKIEGKDWTVLIGLQDGHPRELFALKVKGMKLKGLTGAVLEKSHVDGKSIYSLKSEEVDIYDIGAYYNTADEEFTTRLLSMLFSKGVEIGEILKSLRKARLIIGTFGNVIVRILSRYEGISTESIVCPNCGSKDLVIEEGCKNCKACGWSACS